MSTLRYFQLSKVRNLQARDKHKQVILAFMESFMKPLWATRAAKYILMRVMLNSPINRRLAPIFFGKFFTDFAFWFSIEKLFMQSIGIGVASIGYVAAILSATSLLMEGPSGILADRWSRKGVMIIATASLALSSLLGYLSTNITFYIFAMIIYGFYDAFSSGTSDSMIYDALLDEGVDTKHFVSYLSIAQCFSGVALITSGLIGGIIAENSNLALPYLLTVPTSIAAMICYSLFKDSSRQHESQDANILAQTKNTLGVVFKNANITHILLSLICLGVAGGVIGEMSQTWFLAVPHTIQQFSAASATVLFMWGMSGIMTLFITSMRHLVQFSLLAIAASLGFIMGNSLLIITLALCIVRIVTQGMRIFLTSQIHNFLPSKYRAGAGSAINTSLRLAFIPSVAIFGYIAQSVSVFTASWLITALLALSACIILFAKHRFKLSV